VVVELWFIKGLVVVASLLSSRIMHSTGNAAKKYLDVTLTRGRTYKRESNARTIQTLNTEKALEISTMSP
jgi:hypothetical protein